MRFFLLPLCLSIILTFTAQAQELIPIDVLLRTASGEAQLEDSEAVSAPQESFEPQIEILQDKSFLLSISDTSLEFDTRQPASTNNLEIQIIAETPKKPLLLLKQTQPFSSSSGKTISPTGCDNPETPCSPTFARVWESDRPGIGYKLSGDIIPEDFETEESFRSIDIEGYSSFIQADSLISTLDQTMDIRLVTSPSDELFSGKLELFVIPTL